MIRTPLITSFALTHSQTRFRCRTHDGSGNNPPPNDVRAPKVRSIAPRQAEHPAAEGRSHQFDAPQPIRALVVVPQPRIRVLPRRQQLIARGAGGVEDWVGIVLAVAEQVAATVQFWDHLFTNLIFIAVHWIHTVRLGHRPRAPDGVE